LLETGLGGRLDATNVIACPRLTAISPVSVDHVQFLGGTIEEIAFEKAGILKPGVPAVIGPQPPEARAVIERRAAEKGVPLHRHGREWRVDAEDGGPNGGFVFEFGGETQRYPAPALPGAHQIENGGLALACAAILEEFGLDTAARNAGLAQAEWPGRLQCLTHGPLAEILPEGWELWLDGGHNAAAGAALAHDLANWPPRPLHLVYGMLDTKGAQGFLRPLAPLAETLHAVAIPGEPASLSAEAAAREAAQAGFQAQASENVAGALRAITQNCTPGRVLICGSLYLAGWVLGMEA
jgi:dihydrofolate synthase/folylpolyglutamate synthase